jgi:hypothetical protein
LHFTGVEGPVALDDGLTVDEDAPSERLAASLKQKAVNEVAVTEHEIDRCQTARISPDLIGPRPIRPAGRRGE